MLEPGKLDKGIAGAEHQRHTYCVAERADSGDILRCRRSQISLRPPSLSSASSVSVLPAGGGLHRFNGGQLSIDSAQVIQ